MTAYCTCETPVMDVEHDAGCRRCGLPVDFTPRLRDGWFIRQGTSKAPRDWFVLEYGLSTTTAVRHVVAVIHPDDIGNVQTLYPEAFEVAGQRER